MLFAASAAEAREFTLFGKQFDFNVTTTLRYTYWGDNGNTIPYDDKIHYLFHTMDLALSSSDVRFGMRLDLHHFFDNPLDGCTAGSGPCGHRYSDQWYFARRDAGTGLSVIPPERIFLTLQKKDWSVTLGDFPISFGYGIALTANKVSEIGQDNAIRGGMLRLQKGKVDLTLLAGQFNFLDVDAYTGTAARTIWPEEEVFAGRLEYTFGERVLQVGFHAVHQLRNVPIGGTGGDQHDTIMGLTMSLPKLLGGDLNISSEVDIKRSDNGSCVTRGIDRDCPDSVFDERFHALRGLAAYARASLSRGSWTFTTEFKYFNDYDQLGPQSPFEAYRLTYAQPPTLERVYAIPTETFNTGGGRFRIDYNFEQVGPFELMVYANFTWMRSWGSEGLLQLLDPYGGFELSWMEGKGHWNLVGGYRLERYTDKAETYRTDIHLFGDVEQLLFPRHSVSLNYFYRRSTKQLFSLEEFTQMDMTLGYKWSPYFSAAFYLGYSSEPAAVGEHGKFLPGVELQYFFTASTFLRTYLGYRRGGLICVNGICRVVPQFKGAMVEAVGRF